MLFSNMTLNPQPLHIDAHFCATETEWGRPLMNSLFTLGLMIGISVNDTTVGTTIGNLGMTDVNFPAPLFEGDTVSVTTEVAAKRESRSRPDAGIVDFVHRAYKQDGTLVAECRRQAFMKQAPERLTCARSCSSPATAPEAREGPRRRRRRAASSTSRIRSRSPARTRRARTAAEFLAAARREAKRPRLYVRVNGLTTGLDRRRSRRGHAGGAGRHHAAEDRRRHRRVASRRQARGARGRARPCGRRDPASSPSRPRTRRGVFALGTLAGASHRLAGIAWGGEDLSADVGAETNRGRDGLYADPYRLARALTLFAAAAAEVDAIDTRLHQFPRPRRASRRVPRGAPRRLRRQDGDPPGAGAGHQRGLHALRGSARPRARDRRRVRAESRRGRRRHRRRDDRPAASAPGRAGAGAGRGDTTLAGERGQRARWRSRGRGGPGVRQAARPSK